MSDGRNMSLPTPISPLPTPSTPVKDVSRKNIAEVIVNNPSRSVDKVFHYKIAQEQMGRVKIGVRVLVPFGHGNKKTEAFVVRLTAHSTLSRLKAIYEVVDEAPLFDEKMLYLVKWMRERYLCTHYEAIKAILPPGIGLKLQEWVNLNNELDDHVIEGKIKNSKIQQGLVHLLKAHDGSLEISQLSSLLGSANIRKSIHALCKKNVVSIAHKSFARVKDKTVRIASLAISHEEAEYHLEQIQARAPVQAKMLELLMENEFIGTADLVLFSQGSYSALNALYAKGLIRYKEHVVVRNGVTKDFEKTTAYKPTAEQKNVIELMMQNIEKSVPAALLLRGVTGSGKTEVFLQIIDRILAVKKQAIVLVPEISLTPQMVERFRGRFGDSVAVFHSGLSMGERYDQWKKIKNAEVNVVVGARSAIFAPFQNLGLIVLDEEHENSYKSELAPRYHAREVAMQRSANENAVVLLSSATPGIESYYKAKTGQYQLAHMVRRYNNASLPKVSIVDMRDELVNGNKSIFSRQLKQGIEDNLKNKQQTILFLNRRGYSTFVSCRSCGLVLTCPNCNISLTYHIHHDMLSCHYCGYKRKNTTSCPKCSSKYIRYFGIGTQKAEQEINVLFPEASVIRMDVDTTGKKFSHEKILDTFRNDKIDILIGTQMVSKGLDFPNVTLIGVLAADMSLNIDDFRAAERTFQLLTQVSGRAGRGEIEGRAIIQTYQPDHGVIQLAKGHDYLRFYDSEIQIRKQMNYPPFCQVIAIVVSGPKEGPVKCSINEVIAHFKKKIEINQYEHLCSGILGPTPAPISRIKNKFRWRALLKCVDCAEIREVMRDLLDTHYGNRQNAGINLTIDINPINMY
ncbi:MAG: primosomal protein N' [Firmicutes bacterium]|nr:primosomal protein N' [Bacillota bacterium]